jgi:hypothetical protein
MVFFHNTLCGIFITRYLSPARTCFTCNPVTQAHIHHDFHAGVCLTWQWVYILSSLGDTLWLILRRPIGVDTSEMLPLELSGLCSTPSIADTHWFDSPLPHLPFVWDEHQDLPSRGLGDCHLCPRVAHDSAWPFSLSPILVMSQVMRWHRLSYPQGSPGKSCSLAVASQSHHGPCSSRWVFKSACCPAASS